MILDKRSEFADALALSTATFGTVRNAGDLYDLTDLRDIGQRPMFLVITIDTAVVGTSSTVQFFLVSDAVNPPDVSSRTVHYSSAAIPEATLVAGFKLVIPIPAESPAYERFIGIQHLVGTADLASGKYNAFITLDPAGNKSYPDAVN